MRSSRLLHSTPPSLYQTLGLVASELYLALFSSRGKWWWICPHRKNVQYEKITFCACITVMYRRQKVPKHLKRCTCTCACTARFHGLSTESETLLSLHCNCFSGRLSVKLWLQEKHLVLKKMLRSYDCKKNVATLVGVKQDSTGHVSANSMAQSNWRYAANILQLFI